MCLCYALVHLYLTFIVETYSGCRNMVCGSDVYLRFNCMVYLNLPAAISIKIVVSSYNTFCQ